MQVSFPYPEECVLYLPPTSCQFSYVSQATSSKQETPEKGQKPDPTNKQSGQPEIVLSLDKFFSLDSHTEQVKQNQEKEKSLDTPKTTQTLITDTKQTTNTQTNQSSNNQTNQATDNQTNQATDNQTNQDKQTRTHRQKCLDNNINISNGKRLYSIIDNFSSNADMGHAGSKRSRQLGSRASSRTHKRALEGYKDPSSVGRSKQDGDEDDMERRNPYSQKHSKEIARSLASQPRFLHASKIKLHKLQFGIDKRLTIVDEKSNAVLKYRTPHFRALATVEIPPLPAGVNIQVGWIQVCTEMQFINTYGSEGLTSWEFPEIVSGKYKMVSDADGKQYPWYGSKNEVAHLQGPTQTPTTATVHMNDNFFPQVTWYIPSIGYHRDPSLSFVYRKQRFYSYLALKDVNTDTYQIIRTLTWSMELAIDVNPKKPLGKRAQLLGPFEQEAPRVVPEHLTPPLKSYALNPPNANSCQVLVWRPRYGDTELVVPPVQTTMDMSRYLISTRDATNRFLRVTRSSFLLQQQQQQQQTRVN